MLINRWAFHNRCHVDLSSTCQFEPYLAMIKNKIFLENLEKYLNDEVKNKEKPLGWKRSITVMIPKKVKPMAKELSPIALTDSSYRIFTGLIKREIEEHLTVNDLCNEIQAGWRCSKKKG